MLAASRQHGLEGVLAKRLASTYQPGRRSRDWIKVKNMRTVQPSSAAGPPAGSRRSGGIGALLLGLPDGTGTGQRHIGHVGTGLSAAELADLATRLAGLARDHPPFTAGLTRQAAQQAHSVQPVPRRRDRLRRMDPPGNPAASRLARTATRSTARPMRTAIGPLHTGPLAPTAAGRTWCNGRAGSIQPRWVTWSLSTCREP